MSEIHFEEGQEFVRPVAPEAQTPLFVRLMYATGLVQEKQQAEYVLLGIAVVAIIFGIGIYFIANAKPYTPPPSNAALRAMIALPHTLPQQ